MNETKYPKTWHFPWSESTSSDDHWHTSGRHFDGQEVVQTEKLDGENWTMMRHKAHCRSLDSVSHPSQTRARRHWGEIRHEIPEGWRVCCENLEAMHSIYYRNLPDFLFIIGIYNEDNVCLSWDDTKLYAELFGLPTVPELYRGLWDESAIKTNWVGDSVFETYTEASARAVTKAWPGCDPKPLFVEEMGVGRIASLVPTTGEGYVVRKASEFHHDDFQYALSKFVRKGHVQTSKFWRNEEIIANGRA